MKEYIGNPLQIRGAEKYILEGGKGDGMHFIYVRNGKGLEAWISVDRAADISRVMVNGKNIAYFSPCGYVSPKYYDKVGAGFLKSFTAGFFTTCGLTAVGSPTVDEGEELALHGTVSHIPAELKSIQEDSEGITIKLEVRDCAIFATRLVLERTYRFSYLENTFTLDDTVRNDGNRNSPFMVMYHCNMGYPLVSENAKLVIPSTSAKPRNERSESQMDLALKIESPQSDYEECCYYYDVVAKDNTASVGIFNPDINLGLVMKYDKRELPMFTEWKMMGKTDYVVGLEPANCTPDGRDVMRKQGLLEFIAPDETKHTNIEFKFVEDNDEFNKSLK